MKPRFQINRSHPLLRGCKFFVILDEVTGFQNLMGRGSRGTPTDISPASPSVHGPWLGASFNGTTSKVVFGTQDEYGLTGTGFSVLARVTVTTAQIGVIVSAATTARTSGWQFYTSNFSGAENGILPVVYGGGTFLQQNDSVTQANQLNISTAAGGAFSASGRYPNLSNANQIYSFRRDSQRRGVIANGNNSSAAASWTPSNTRPIVFGQESESGLVKFTGTVEWVMIFDHAIHGAKIARLLDDSNWPFLGTEDGLTAVLDPSAIPVRDWTPTVPRGRFHPVAGPVRREFPQNVSPPGAAAAAAAATQVLAPAPSRFAPVRGPWSLRPFLPVRPTDVVFHLLAPVPPVPQVTAPFTCALMPPWGPWNRFGRSTPVPLYPSAFGSGSAPDPGQTGSVSYAGATAALIPRAPRETDDRLRPHIDKVSVLLNALIRAGYIRSVGRDQFAVNGGAYVLSRVPTATDDESVGVNVGNLFVDDTTSSVYVCVDNSRGSAVWQLVGDNSGTPGPQGEPGVPGPTGATGPTGPNALSSVTTDSTSAVDLDMADSSIVRDDSAPTFARVPYSRVFGLVPPTPGGRLTLTTAVPVTASDVTSAGTVYYTPYKGNQWITLWDGTRWTTVSFSEVSLALSSLTSGKNYDVFAYLSSGSLALELSAAWTSDTARNEAVSVLDGRHCKTSDKARLLLGTLRTTGTATTEDSKGKRFLANVYNPERKTIRAQPGYNDDNATSSYSHTGSTFSEVNGGTGSRAEFVVPIAGHLDAYCSWTFSSSATGSAFVAIGVDSTGTAYSQAVIGTTSTLSRNLICTAEAMFTQGYHYFAMLARSAAGTATIFADDVRGGSASDPRYSYLQGSGWF